MPYAEHPHPSQFSKSSCEKKGANFRLFIGRIFFHYLIDVTKL